MPVRNALRLSDRPASVGVNVVRVTNCGRRFDRDESLVVEEPLEIQIQSFVKGVQETRPVAVTMRTPGDDEELALGFLVTESIIAHPSDLGAVISLGNNRVAVELHREVKVDFGRLERHSFTSSSCGVCGKTSLDAVRIPTPAQPIDGWPTVRHEVILGLPDSLRAAQAVFDRTGGLHASALFDSAGRLVSLREDVGRHNALDKLIGNRFLTGELPLTESVLLLSGRVSFELVQKAAVAGIPIVATVGAPSSLARDLAEELGMTLVGFLRPDHFNIYSGPERISDCSPTTSS